MKRVIQFSNARYVFFAISLALFVTGAVGYVVNHGLNLGVDFKAGISFQFQIAPAAFSIKYTGADQATITIPAGEAALTSPGNFLVTITDPATGIKTIHPFKWADYATIRELVDAIAKIPEITVQPLGSMDVSPSRILPPAGLMDIAAKSQTVNIEPAAVQTAPVDISDIRAILEPMGRAEIQVAGNPASQMFIARFEATTQSEDFQITTQNALIELLGARYGADEILIMSSEFAGPQMAQSLASQTVVLVLIAIAGILIYMLLRFKPIYAFAAVIGVLHDAVVMLAFDGIFRVTVDAGTIAAILTILGYSINDTIVNFDRTRENLTIMRGASLRSIIDTSVTQNLGRTFITSGATLISVIALFVLTTGTIKNFSLNMLVGLVEGTYSTFISSFIVIEWTRIMERRRTRRDMTRFGITREKPGEDELEDEEPPENVPVATPVLEDSTLAHELSLQAKESGSSGAAAPEAPAAQNGEQSGAEKPAEGKVISFPGGTAQQYRYLHKRRKKRHH
jgi:preprotein translocase subunit SecF